MMENYKKGIHPTGAKDAYEHDGLVAFIPLIIQQSPDLDYEKLQKKQDEKLEKFDDNVNSAVCSCVNPVWNYYQSHGARFYQAPRYFYPVHNHKTRGSFVERPSQTIKKYSFKIL